MLTIHAPLCAFKPKPAHGQPALSAASCDDDGTRCQGGSTVAGKAGRRHRGQMGRKRRLARASLAAGDGYSHAIIWAAGASTSNAAAHVHALATSPAQRLVDGREAVDPESTRETRRLAGGTTSALVDASGPSNVGDDGLRLARDAHRLREGLRKLLRAYGVTNGGRAVDAPALAEVLAVPPLPRPDSPPRTARPAPCQSCSEGSKRSGRSIDLREPVLEARERAPQLAGRFRRRRTLLSRPLPACAASGEEHVPMAAAVPPTGQRTRATATALLTAPE